MPTDLYNLLSHNGEAKIGVDGSLHQRETKQGSIRWEDAKRHGISFMIWRAVLRGWRNDNTCIPNLVRAAEVGIPYRGIYVVLDANESLSSHMRLLEQIWRDIEGEFGSGEYMPRIWLDDEVRGREIEIPIKKNGKKVRRVYKKFTPARINHLHDQVAKEVYHMQGGEEPGYYSYPSFVIDSKGTLNQREHVTKRHKGKVWLAFYHKYWPIAQKEKAIPDRWIPPEWKDGGRVDKGIDIYQFGSEMNRNHLGPVLGGDADHFDINKAFKTDEEMNEMFHVGYPGGGISDPIPEPIPEPIPVPIEIDNAILLNVPYKSQRDPDAKTYVNDCGPSCVAMVLNGHGLNVTTDEVHRATGAPKNQYVTISQMRKAAKSYGIEFDYFYPWTLDDLKQSIDAGKAPIALVHYGAWSKLEPGISTQSSFTGPHFVVVVGYDDKHIYVNDPLWWGDRRSEGERKRWTYAEFEAAWNSASKDGNRNNSGIVCTVALASEPDPGSIKFTFPIGDNIDPLDEAVKLNRTAINELAKRI